MNNLFGNHVDPKEATCQLVTQDIASCALVRDPFFVHDGEMGSVTDIPVDVV
ncbi:hypothetical protein INS90_00670 [Trueperella pecoris]|uniref:Uncharacterized protein n=1 Tax=Trueperella pecoris TaxID=2733571 RepID=A0A7M1R143_9ACTO|nr:hypothetical protein [Trueperella pecoris]QOR47863.1 hypothetical protein INS90_00670 [Trueperella pecoris]